jgi:beta-fructofuranosidase
MAGIHGGNPMTEPIEMNIFVDGSLVEVFVNDLSGQTLSKPSQT